MRFIHAADFHLERTFKRAFLDPNVYEKRRRDLWRNFENTIDICNEKNVDFLFIAGDLFERESFSQKDQRRLLDLIGSLEKTRLVIAPGNHDYIDKNSPYEEISKYAYVFMNDKHSYFDFEDLQVRVHGMGWRKDFYNKKFEIDEGLIHPSWKNILVLHTGVEDGNYLPVELKDLSKHFDYIALGHIHKAAELLPNAYYPGSPEGLSFKEAWQHGVIYFDEKSVNFLETSLRKIVDISLDCEGLSLKEIFRKIEDIVYKNKDDLIRIRLVGKSDFYYKENFDKEIYQKAFYFEIISDLQPNYDLKKIYEANKDRALGSIIKKLADPKDALKQRALDLILKEIVGGGR